MFPDSNSWFNRVADFRDSMVAYTNYHGKYPKQIDAALYTLIDAIGSATYLINYNPQYAKMKGTNVVIKILDTFEKKMSNPNSPLKYLGLSAHDSTVLPLMMDLKISDPDCLIKKINNKGVQPPGEKWCYGNPPYASNFIFELSKDSKTGNFYVRVMFNGQLVDSLCPQGVKVLEGGFCPYADAKKIITEKLIWTDNYAKTCDSNAFIISKATPLESGYENVEITEQESETDYSGNYFMILEVIVMGVVVLSILGITYVVNRYMRMRKDSKNMDYIREDERE